MGSAAAPAAPVGALADRSGTVAEGFARAPKIVSDHLSEAIQHHSLDWHIRT